MSNHQDSLTEYIAAFVAELVQAGITEVVVSPGSRSTPMAMVMAEHPELHLYIHVDERSAAFFALGMAKASKKPVAILCTSGTAAANYYPAIVEAHYSRVPLMVLTADRPHELRDIGAPQAIDQNHLYGHHVKWFAEMAPPENSIEMLHYVRSVGARATAVSLQAPAGPVHLNFPFREPLIPNLDKDIFQMEERPHGYVNVQSGELLLSDEEINEIACQIQSHKRGIIVCGQLEEEGFSQAVISLAKKLSLPILADPLSQLRSGNHLTDFIIDSYDTFLRNDHAKQFLKPDLVIRFGAMPVSKALTIFLKENHQALQYVVDGGAGWRDPAHLSTNMIYSNETAFCEKLASAITCKLDNMYLRNWQDINHLTKEALISIKDTAVLNESRLFAQLADMLPEGATLFVGNSMPIRDLDSFFHNNQKSIRIMANRGANGIDGTVSTALGAAVYSKSLYLILGDLTFFHDLNGLLAAKLYDIPIHIMVINNNGGGIFSFLPQSEHRKNFELLFGTPLNLDFELVVKMYNGKFTRISSWDHFSTLLESFKENKGLQVWEIPTNRERNLKEHRDIWNQVSREISNFVNGCQL